MALTVGEMIVRAETVHSAIADAICPDGEAGYMTCREGCGTQYDIDAVDVATYLRYGWPRCCHREMRWVQPPRPTASADAAAGARERGGA